MHDPVDRTVRVSPDRGLSSRLRRVLAELTRRPVLHVAGAYGAGAFLAIEGADLVLPRIGLPDAAVTFVVWTALAAFPVALGLAWRFERGEEGLGVTPAATEAELSKIVNEPAIRRWPAGLLALADVVMLAVGAWLTLPDRVSVAFDGAVEEDVVAALPFSVRGGAAYAYLSTGMVDLLTTLMDGVGAIRTVPARAVMGLAQQEGASTLERYGEPARAEGPEPRQHRHCRGHGRGALRHGRPADHPARGGVGALGGGEGTATRRPDDGLAPRPQVLSRGREAPASGAVHRRARRVRRGHGPRLHVRARSLQDEHRTGGAASPAPPRPRRPRTATRPASPSGTGCS